MNFFAPHQSLFTIKKLFFLKRSYLCLFHWDGMAEMSPILPGLKNLDKSIKIQKKFNLDTFGWISSPYELVTYPSIIKKVQLQPNIEMIQ